LQQLFHLLAEVANLPLEAIDAIDHGLQELVDLAESGF